MPADLFIYALVAAGLVFWLKNVLGTRPEDEDVPPSVPVKKGEAGGATLLDLHAAAHQDQQDPAELIEDLTREPQGAMGIENDTARDGLLDILKTDKFFNIKEFLQNAQDAFVYIVEAFAEGDREALEDMLDTPVYDAFESAITQREKDGEAAESEIHAIRQSKVIEAELKGRMAFVTVRFVAEETSAIRDSDGEVLSGHPDRVTEMTDIWTFGRDTKSKDPRWFLIQTRGDFDGDNEMIPNTE